MKRFLSIAILGLFAAGMAGCHAEIGGNDDTAHTSSSKTTKDTTGSSYEKKTTVDSDGNKTVKTETKNY